MMRPVPGLLCCLLLLAPASAAAQREIAVPTSAYAARRARLFEQVGRQPVLVPGAYLVRSGGEGRQDPDFWYLTGIESPYAVLLIYPDGTPDGASVVFLPDSFQFAGAQYSIPDERFRYSAWNRTILRIAPGEETARRLGVEESLPIDGFTDALARLVGDSEVLWFLRDTGRLYAPPGLSGPRSYRQQLEEAVASRLPGVRIENVSPLLHRMRLIKDAHEIEALRTAARISATGLLSAMKAIAPGKNDLEIAGVMEATWKAEGSTRAAFAPIVVSGDAAVSLYTLRSEKYNHTWREMKDGELIFIDYGAAEYDMYGSDLCRTFPVSGHFSDEQRRYYEIVLEAQEAALARIRPGVRMEDVIRAAAGVFKAHGLQRNEDIDTMGADRVWGLMPSPTYWVDGPGELTDYSGARGTGVRDLGHHIGLDATDSRDYSTPLQPGMVFTVEPKLYIPELGIAIMIEDMILVTEDGYENLSVTAPKTVEEIEAVMRR